MSNFSNITVNQHDDGMVSLLINGKAISDKYATKFEAHIVDELKALDDGQAMKLFDQFIFSHTDLNFEHRYQYVTGILKLSDGYQLHTNFVYQIIIEGQPNIEHVITKQGQPMNQDDIREFIQSHMQKSLNDYTDLKYAY